MCTTSIGRANLEGCGQFGGINTLSVSIHNTVHEDGGIFTSRRGEDYNQETRVEHYKPFKVMRETKGSLCS